MELVYLLTGFKIVTSERTYKRSELDCKDPYFPFFLTGYYTKVSFGPLKVMFIADNDTIITQLQDFDEFEEQEVGLRVSTILRDGRHNSVELESRGEAVKFTLLKGDELIVKGGLPKTLIFSCEKNGQYKWHWEPK